MKDIFALKVNPEWTVRIYDSLKQGEGRFGWSYIETADLRSLRKRFEEGDTLTEKESHCYQPFLLDIEVGDHVVFINVPAYGECTTARVNEKYYWKWEKTDFSHRFGVDPKTVFTFNRNDSAVHPALSARLKLQGRWWHIYAKDEFQTLLSEHQLGKLGQKASPDDRIIRLAEECRPHLSGVTQAIHHTHPGKQLEELFEVLFTSIPGVKEVKAMRGSADKGADLIAVMEHVHPITQQITLQTCVIQVKSYEGEHSDTRAVKDIRRAFIAHPEATEGLIISTADTSAEVLEKELYELKEELGKPVHLIVGSDVAGLLLKYGQELLYKNGNAGSPR